MFLQILVGALVIFCCIAIQAMMLGTAFIYLKRFRPTAEVSQTMWRISILIGSVAIWLMLVHAVSISVWALAFFGLGIFSEWGTALYFSAVAFTTLGFGDVILPAEWRQLAGFCAAHGLLVFGLSSAALVETFRQSVEAHG